MKHVIRTAVIIFAAVAAVLLFAPDLIAYLVQGADQPQGETDSRIRPNRLERG